METLKNLSGGQKFIIGLIIGLVVGWGGSFFALDKSRGSSSKSASSEESKDSLKNTEESANGLNNNDGSISQPGYNKKAEAVIVSGTNAIEVNDQPAGNNVEITMATLSKAGWVVIHEDDNGAAGKVLGARRYEPGIYSADVELLRPTESGKMYYAMLHIDDGDKEFNLGKDAPIKGENGAVVMDSFKAQ